ncbi:tRNA pseudouridine(38-40) synthase TruA [Flavobacteriales bacterium]|nr:tRNA pseudouridine(38-40) synthase TruA [Flavobacteriales bacterium]
MRYFVKLAYNGTDFHGWQIQPEAASIQEEIEEKLSTILQEKTSILGCGRTDAGVHAKEFYAHFDSENIEFELDHLTHKLNTMVHAHIAIQNINPVVPKAHARFDATKRSYEYHISKTKDPFGELLTYKLSTDLNLDSMNKACQLLLGEQDFTSFCKAKAENHTKVCTVFDSNWKKEGNRLVFRITANRYLRNMVRAIVGTMLDIGQGKMEVEELKCIITSQDRTRAGRSVPAHGLYLSKVEYPSEIFSAES